MVVYLLDLSLVGQVVLLEEREVIHQVLVNGIVLQIILNQLVFHILVEHLQLSRMQG